MANAGFEDVSGQTEFNEFTFGQPAGWDFHDPAGIIGSAGTYTGTLEPNGTEFFSSTAPEGVKVSILFNEDRQGEGEYGYQQTLVDTLQADTRYELTVLDATPLPEPGEADVLGAAAVLLGLLPRRRRSA